MSTPSEAPLAPPDRDRAVHALERAVACAERGVADRPVVLIEAADIALLEPKDVRARLDRVMMGEYADEGLDSLLATGVLDAVLPEIKAMVGFGDGEWRHKDVWKHTKQVVTQSVPRIEVRYGALFHDIGKVKTRSISPDGEVHFFGHAEVGARMFDKLERRRKLFSHDEALRDEVRFLVLHHLRASQYDGKWTDSAVRRFAREIGPSLDNLLCLSRADITTKRPEKKRRGINMIDGLAERIALLAAEDAKQPPLPTGLGNELMTVFGIPPSKKLGDIKRALELAVEAGEIEERLESSAYIQFIAERKARFGIE
jgi:poly(A) polymerase